MRLRKGKRERERERERELWREALSHGDNHGAAAQASGEAAGRSGEASSAARSVAAARESQGELGEARRAMAGVLTFASSLNFASTPAPASTCIFDDAAVAAGIRSEIRSEIYDGVIINPAAEQREPDAAAEAGSEVTNLRMHAPKKKARVAPPRRDPEISRDLPIPI